MSNLSHRKSIHSGLGVPLRCLLRGAGQVMFQGNALTGALFLCGILWGAVESRTPELFMGALVGLVAATATGMITGLRSKDGRDGLWGFNGILVGCAMPVLLGNTPQMWLMLVLTAAMTVWLREGLNRVMAKHRINSLTFPFVLATWLMVAAAHRLGALGVAEAHHIDVCHTVSVWSVVEAWLKGVSQIFFVDSAVAGAIFLAGLAVSNLRAAVWTAAGSAVGMVVAWWLDAPHGAVFAGLYGYSPALTALALATVFYRPTFRSAAWALLGAVMTVPIQAAVAAMLAPCGITALTAPFCFATWIFLLPLLPLDKEPSPDHSVWN